MITIVLAFIETYFIELLYRRIILGKLLKRRIKGIWHQQGCFHENGLIYI